MMVGAGELASPWIQGGGATVRGAREPYFDKLTGFGTRGKSGSGSVVMMADGSTRFLSGDIDPDVFRAMCTIHGGESVDSSQLGSEIDLVPRQRGSGTEQHRTRVIVILQ